MALTTLFKRAYKVRSAWLEPFYLCGASCAAITFGYFWGIACYAIFDHISKITVPATVYQACVNRVFSDQAALFEGNQPTSNSALCDSGFIGDSDIYGLGVRSGLYIQWVSSLLANYLLREEGTALMRSYLFFHIALCIAVAVLTFQKTCTFAVEIVLLYYLVYGGFVCVFNRPNLGDCEPAMMDLHWSQVVLFLSFLTMGIHVVWFILFGHPSFPNMPCGTTIFFFGPVKNDWTDLLAILLLFIFSSLVSVMTIWICGFCILSAVDPPVSTMKSLLYRGLFSMVRYRSVVQLQSAIPRYLRFSKLLESLAAQPGNIRSNYGSALRRYFRTYAMSRPVHGQRRRINQIVFLAIGLFTLVWSILAIELTIHWNNISDMYALDTTGQYVPLAVGLGGFVRTLYGVLKLWLGPNKKHPDPHGIELVHAQSHEAAASHSRSGRNASESLNAGPSDTPLERRVATF